MSADATFSGKPLAIRELERDPPAAALLALAELLGEAYPVYGLDSPEKLAAFVDSLRSTLADPDTHQIVAETDAGLTGAMKLYDFTMNLRGRDAATGGVGGVAVSLANKRRGVARTMIAWYLQRYRSEGAAFAALHAFRPAFYRKLGFGYGTPTHRYRFLPATLLVDGGPARVRALGVDDLDEVLACSDRVRVRTNGCFAKQRPATERLLRDRKVRYVGVFQDLTLRAFMQTTVVLGEAGRTNDNALVARELYAESDDAFASLLGYLRSQSDQFAAIVVESQDAALYLASDDPRDGSDVVVAPPATHRIAETGLGIMYRLLDVPKAFDYLPGTRSPFTLRVRVDDPFFSATNGTWTFNFGACGVAETPAASETDGTLGIGVADLASLIVGSLSLRSIVRHRLATVTPESMLAPLDAAFRADAPPVCYTRF